MADDSKPSGSWWATLPGIITACGGLIGAATAMIVALNQAGLIGKQAGKDTAPQVELAPPPQPGPAQAEADHAPAPKQAALPTPGGTVAESAPAAEATAKPADAPETPVAKPATANGTGAERYLVRIVLKGDPATYFITVGHDIVSVAANAEPTRVGQRTPPTLNGYVGHFLIGGRDYEVDRHGQVWRLAAAGGVETESAGHATRLKQAAGD